MNKKLRLSIFVISAFLLLGFEQVFACSCSGGANPCGSFRAAESAVFIGTVTNVVDVNEKYGQPINGKARKITIKVDEIFKGSLPSEIITSDDGFQCDNYPFKLGNTYLIYAKGVLENTENIVKVGLCGGTKPLAQAQEDLRFLRPLKEGKNFSLIYGKVEKFIDQKDLPNQLLKNIKIVLTKESSIENGEYKKPKKKERIIETYTDENGEYSFSDILPGRYKIRVDLPDGLWMRERGEFGAGGSPFCENHSFLALTDGRISGKISNADGTPATALQLSIQPLHKEIKFYQYSAQTDKDGNYTFFGIPAGEYKIFVGLHGYTMDTTKPTLFTVGYPFWYWYFPGTFDVKRAETINLADAEKIRNVDLKMPPFPVKQTVEGIVVLENQVMVKGVSIYYKVKGKDEVSNRYIQLKEDGSFSFQIYEEFEYEVFASR